MKKKSRSIWWHKSIEKREILNSISKVIKSEDLSTGNLTSQLEKKNIRVFKGKTCSDGIQWQHGNFTGIYGTRN